MSGAGPVSGFLEFFILEAGDYVEQLDAVLLGSGNPGGPDSDAIQRTARALRGSATMAKIPAFADLASGVERLGRALQEGALKWDPALGGVLVAAVDDLKLLLRAARSWSPSDEQRASTRAAELARYIPARPVPAAAPAARAAASTVPSTTAFFATEAANIAAGLELLTTRAGDAETAANVLRRVRALRGVAGVKEIGPLADALEATEDAARNLEAGDEEMGPESRQLLEAAAAHLRTLSTALRGDGDVNAPSSTRDAFTAALDNWNNRSIDGDRVVPIADLFYADGAPGLVEASQNPPTSMADRFRLELVSLGEHLRQVVANARGNSDPSSIQRARRDLRRVLRAMQSAAESFGEHDVAEFIAGHLEAADHVDFLGLAALEDLASVLAEPGTEGERLMARLREISGGRDFSSAIGAGFGESEPTREPVAAPQPHAPRTSSPLAIPTPAFSSLPPQPMPDAPPGGSRTPMPATPRATLPAHATQPMLDAGSAALIDSSIAALDALDSHPLVAPTSWPDEDVVPIDRFLYRGRAALDRAVELRDEMKRSGNRSDNAALDELFDLLELARAE